MNIYDVSERAAFAYGSRVLNGNPNVSERTRKKVPTAVMDELGYTPNVFCQGTGT